MLYNVQGWICDNSLHHYQIIIGLGQYDGWNWCAIPELATYHPQKHTCTPTQKWYMVFSLFSNTNVPLLAMHYCWKKRPPVGQMDESVITNFTLRRQSEVTVCGHISLDHPLTRLPFKLEKKREKDHSLRVKTHGRTQQRGADDTNTSR